MSTRWIAEDKVVFVAPSGARTEGRIAVGLPYEDKDNAWCPVALEGLYGSHRIAGVNNMQALLAAVRFLGTMLYDFTSNGGRVLAAEPEADNEVEFRLDALFGPLLCPLQMPRLADESD